MDAGKKQQWLIASGALIACGAATWALLRKHRSPSGLEKDCCQGPAPPAPNSTAVIPKTLVRGHTAAGSKCESNAENRAAFKRGELAHEPPMCERFDHCHREAIPVHIKEIKLPLAEQTHEVCYDPVTNCCYVSQMSNSTLVRIPMDSSGFLFEDQSAWCVGIKDPKTGKGIGGLHNISLSKKHPGCIWLSMQYRNQLILMDVRAQNCLRVLKVVEVPTYYTDPSTGRRVPVGGPHCMRECPVTGDIWAGLKGALKNSPCGKAASSCCNPEKLKKNMKTLEEMGLDTPMPVGWAVWQLNTDNYHASAADGAKGGVLYPCLDSPPMLDFDSEGNVYVPQDNADTLMYINRTTGSEQLEIPFPTGEPPRGGSDPRITGPAIKTAPDGSIWMSQLGSYSALVRIDPSDNKRTLYNFGGPIWAEKIRFIHIAFSAASAPGEHNVIYALASDLLDCAALDAIMMLRMSPDWKKCTGWRLIPLPTQNCAAHRVVTVDTGIEGRPDLSKSIVITELEASKLLQIKTANIGDFVALNEEISTCAKTGCEVRTYVRSGRSVGWER